ncbi:MAG: hypothetical protein AB7E80_10605 [Hyphomicrobiaceae bacterium]
MIAIIITACLVSDPGVCRDHKLPLFSDVSAGMCALYAPPHFGKWTDEHPGWKIVRWRCAPATAQDI